MVGEWSPTAEDEGVRMTLVVRKMKMEVFREEVEQTLGDQVLSEEMMRLEGVWSAVRSRSDLVDRRGSGGCAKPLPVLKRSNFIGNILLFRTSSLSFGSVQTCTVQTTSAYLEELWRRPAPTAGKLSQLRWRWPLGLWTRSFPLPAARTPAAETPVQTLTLSREEPLERREVLVPAGNDGSRLLGLGWQSQRSGPWPCPRSIRWRRTLRNTREPSTGWPESLHGPRWSSGRRPALQTETRCGFTTSHRNGLKKSNNRQGAELRRGKGPNLKIKKLKDEKLKAQEDRRKHQTDPSSSQTAGKVWMIQKIKNNKEIISY